MVTVVSKEFWDDLKWGRAHYAELQKRFKDQWVAIVDKQVVSYGKNLRKVEEEARKLTGRKEVYTTYVESGAAIY